MIEPRRTTSAHTRPDSKRYVLAFTAVVAVILFGAASFCYQVDPYWLWHREPIWHKLGESDRALDDRMRYAKALQTILRQPKIVLLGSSRVYRGLNPAHIKAANVYNLGISSLHIHEAEAYVRYLVRWTDVDTIVLGLDFFSFDARRPYIAGFDPNLGNIKFFFEAFPAALIGVDALQDAQRARSSTKPDPDGTWQRDGFKRPNPRSAADIQYSAQAMLNDTYRGYILDSSGFTALQNVIRLCRSRGVNLLLYISPLSDRQMDLIQLAGDREMYTAWRTQLQQLAIRNGTVLWDFQSNNPYAGSDPTHGSTRYYWDTSHFSDVIGDLVLERLGFTITTPPPESTERFGLMLSPVSGVTPNSPGALRFSP